MSGMFFLLILSLTCGCVITTREICVSLTLALIFPFSYPSLTAFLGEGSSLAIGLLLFGFISAVVFFPSPGLGIGLLLSKPSVVRTR